VGERLTDSLSAISINGRYQTGARVTEQTLAKLFMHGRSQAVRLPKAFRLPGTEVRVRRLGRGVLLEPLDLRPEDVRAVFQELDRLGGADFMPEGRAEQLKPPPVPDLDG
jgi:antitoxin VapB